MIGIIGSGCWATAIVQILLEAHDRRVNWWVRRSEVAKALATSGSNPCHLPQVKHDRERLSVSDDLAAVVAASDVLVVAVPSFYVAEVLGSLPREAYDGKRMVSVVKGYVPQLQMGVAGYLRSELHVPEEDICVVSGPSHAEEVANRQPTFLNVASANAALAAEVATLLGCSYIHTVMSDKVQEIEFCGLAKNVYAVAAGMAAGLGYGDNLVAVLATAAVQELRGLIGLGDEPQFMLGDLMVTCFSHHSRNRALGEAVARGVAAKEYLTASGMVAEGYYSAQVMHSLHKEAPAPIAEAVYRVLHEGGTAKKEMDQLIDRCFQ